MHTAWKRPDDGAFMQALHARTYLQVGDRRPVDNIFLRFLHATEQIVER